MALLHDIIEKAIESGKHALEAATSAQAADVDLRDARPVSYTHLRAHET